MSSQQVLRRISTEHANLRGNPVGGCSADPVDEDNLLQWTGKLSSIPDSAYAGTTFEIGIEYPENYPFRPPQVAFTTPMFHPNVSSTGEVALGEFEDSQWSPCVTIRLPLFSLQAMLSDPNPGESCAVNEEAAKLYAEDPGAFRRKTRQISSGST